MSSARAAASQPTKLLIVDDEPAFLNQLRLALQKDFEVWAAESAEAAWTIVQAEHPELVTLDLALDGASPESGFTLLERCLAFDPFMKIVLVTGNDNEANALRAVDQGAADFFGKPVDVAELKVLLSRVLALGRLERRNAALLAQLGEEHRLGSLVGRSQAMRAVFRRIEKLAAVDIAVLIVGESGTGKELVARELRRLGPRAAKPFKKIDCGAIPENLLESELFGHEEGAFTDARVGKRGRLEMAQGGVVFLDEIGDLPFPLQVKLLRFLQEHQIERVGGLEVIDLDVRVIAATNKDLAGEVRRGRFRQDLYYRLSVGDIELPPLRERREDILFLAQFFLDRYVLAYGRGRLAFSARCKRALERHDWPGNIRELENRIEKAVVMASGRLLDEMALGLLEPAERRPASLREARRETERQTIRAALRGT
ncbi:MAG: sigma-54-dependent Fis family transcriptional regulator, partial [Candidatus Eisenbacteria bacterium]|nr:sigma-54-dependent Fis family transcriptional regulator [Candidatus Eisenbacteria bacterium]